MIVIMTEVTVSAARARLADVVDDARVSHEPVFLTRRGRRVAAVIDADDLERLVDAADDLADIKGQVADEKAQRTGEATEFRQRRRVRPKAADLIARRQRLPRVDHEALRRDIDEMLDPSL